MTALGSLTIFYRTTLYHNSSNAMEQTDAVLSTLNDLLSLMFLSVSGGGYFEFPISDLFRLEFPWPPSQLFLRKFGVSLLASLAPRIMLTIAPIFPHESIK